MTQEDDFNTNLAKLKIGTELTTATKRKSEISNKTYKDVEIFIHKSRKKRCIEIDDIKKAYIYLRQGNKIEGVEGERESILSIIGDRKRTYSYVWAILSNFEDIETKDIQLSYKF